jgi:hypothetical protein
MLAAVTLVGCGGAGGPSMDSPRATLTALQRAADRGDAATLYALLPDGARRTESFAAFQARIRTEQPELHDLGSALLHQQESGIAPQVELALRSGSSIAVVDDADGWRVAEPGLGTSLATTPAAAARALREALVRQSLPSLLAILSSTARGALRAEMQAIIDALADPSALETTLTSNNGQRLELRLPDGHTLRLVREGANWRVDDVQ